MIEPQFLYLQTGVWKRYLLSASRSKGTQLVLKACTCMLKMTVVSGVSGWREPGSSDRTGRGVGVEEVLIVCLHQPAAPEVLFSVVWGEVHLRSHSHVDT